MSGNGERFGRKIVKGGLKTGGGHDLVLEEGKRLGGEGYGEKKKS